MTQFRVQLVRGGEWREWGLPYSSRDAAERAANKAYPDLGTASHRCWRVIEVDAPRYAIEVQDGGKQWLGASLPEYASRAAAEKAVEQLAHMWPDGTQWRICQR